MNSENGRPKDRKGAGKRAARAVPTDKTARGAPEAEGKTGSDGDTNPAPDTGLTCLVMLSRYFEKPVDPGHLAHEFKPHDEAMDEVALLRAAKACGFKAKALDVTAQQLEKIALPAMGRGKDGGWFVIGRAGFAAVLKADGAAGAAPPEAPEPEPVFKILIQDPGRAGEGNGIAELTTAEFEARFSGRAICLTTRAELAAKQSKFDLSWFVPAVVRYRKLFGEVLLASFFLQLFGLISPLFFQVVIDKVLIHRGLSSLDVLIFALIAVSIFEVVFGGLRTYIFSHTTNRIDVQLGANLYKHLIQLPIGYFGVRRVGETVARVRELDNIRDFLTGSALTLIVDLAFTIVFFAVMFYFAPLLTWIVVGSLPFYIAISLFVSPMLRQRVEEKFARGAENTAFLTESVTGIETVKAMAVEPQMHRRWEEQLAAYVKASFRAASLGNIASHSVQLVQKVSMALTLYFGAKLVMDGDLSVGQLVAFNMLSGRVSQPILRLAQLWQDFQQMRISIERLGDILNSRTEVAGGQTNLPPVKGRVSFDRVTFRYRPDGPEILKGITLDIPEGQSVGIVGPSGSGKSTLTKLVQRMYVPESGRVTIDGIDLGLAAPSWLRRQVGVVLQENYLFNRPVWENIALSNPGLPRETIVAAAQMAGAHDFILELPEAYDTVIEERGASLSGGQRQRIAIARALVTNPRILILDEATSALDYESEEIIQRNMRQICAGRTVFIIAHRLSTVRTCDRIITIEKGAIVEDGTHDALMGTDGRYARLWKQQMAGIGMMPQQHPGPRPVQQGTPQPHPPPHATHHVPQTPRPHPTPPQGQAVKVTGVRHPMVRAVAKPKPNPGAAE